MIPGNITATISDHLPQFLFAPNVISKNSCQKSNIYERDWSEFIQTDFEIDYFDKDWSDNLQLQPSELALAIGNCRSKCRGKQHFPRQKNYRGNICSVEKIF